MQVAYYLHASRDAAFSFDRLMLEKERLRASKSRTGPEVHIGDLTVQLRPTAPDPAIRWYWSTRISPSSAPREIRTSDLIVHTEYFDLVMQASTVLELVNGSELSRL